VSEGSFTNESSGALEIPTASGEDSGLVATNPSETFSALEIVPASGEVETMTMAEAARRTGTSRRTIARLIEADRIAGAVQDARGVWHLPVDGLLRAGLRIDEPIATPGEIVEEWTARYVTRAETAEAERDELRVLLADVEAERDELRQRAEAAEAAVIELRHRAELAEAVAVERSERITELRTFVNVFGQRELTVNAEQGRRWWQRKPRTETTAP
jgi:hypothetical protein